MVTQARSGTRTPALLGSTQMEWAARAARPQAQDPKPESRLPGIIKSEPLENGSRAAALGAATPVTVTVTPPGPVLTRDRHGDGHS